MKRSTTLGLSVSCGLIALLLWNFIQSDFFLKQSPYVVAQSVAQVHALPVVFGPDSLVAFSIGDVNNVNYIEPSIFNMTVSYLHLDTINGVYTPIFKKLLGYHPCSDADTPGRSGLIASIGLTNALCLDDKDILVEGYWDESMIYQVLVELWMCDNATSNNTCKSQDEIDAWLSDDKFFTGTLDGNVIDANDYENPFKKKMEAVFQFIDIHLLKKMDCFFKQIEMQRNDGGIVAELFTQHGFVRHETQTDIKIRGPQNPLFQFQLYASKQKQIVTRRYQSIGEALASLSGTANFVMIFGAILARLQNYIESIQILLNSLYHFPNVNKNSPRKKKIASRSANHKKIAVPMTKKPMDTSLQKMQEKKPRPITSDSNYSSHNTSLNELVLNLNRPADILHKRTEVVNINQSVHSADNIIPHPNKSRRPSGLGQSPNAAHKPSGFGHSSTSNALFKTESPQTLNGKLMKLTIGFWEFVKYYIKDFFDCQFSPKEKILKKSCHLYKKELDAMKFLRRMQEIEKLKLILLNDDQLLLFHSLTKPMVMVDKGDGNDDGLQSSSRKIAMLLKGKNKMKEQKTFGTSYERVQKKAVATDSVDARLLELVDQNMIKFKS